MQKNPTPNGISIYSAAIVAGFSLLVALLSKYVFGFALSQYVLFLLPISVFVCAVLVFKFFLNHFIHRKIKLIYKTILDQKKQNATALYDRVADENDIISVVEKEVLDWA